MERFLGWSPPSEKKKWFFRVECGNENCIELKNKKLYNNLSFQRKACPRENGGWNP